MGNIIIIKKRDSDFAHTGYKVDIWGNKTNCTDDELAEKVGHDLPDISYLGDYNETTKQWSPNTDIIEYFNQDVKTVTYKSGDYTYYITPSLVKFKSAVFKCTEVKYNNEGRVAQMTFEEK